MSSQHAGMNSDHRLVYDTHQVLPAFWSANTGGLCCWLDTEVFDGPIFSYPVRKDQNTWVVRGVFCSLHCAKRYIIDNCFVNTTVFTLFSLMCIKVYGITDEIVAAPSMELLKKFSTGSHGLTIHEFRSKAPAHHVYRITAPPLFPFKFPVSFVTCEQLHTPDARTSSPVVQAKTGREHMTISSFYTPQPVSSNEGDELMVGDEDSDGLDDA